MAITMNYAGVDTQSMLQVLSVKRSLASSRKIDTRQKQRRGAWFKNVYNAVKIIEVEIAISSVDLARIPFRNISESATVDFSQNLSQMREIARLLNQNEPKQLIFSDEPHVYYNAILQDETVLNQLSDYYATTTLSFMVPDGVGHALVEQRIGLNRDRLLFTNRSYASVAPRFEFVAPSDLKMFALLHPSGEVFQIGNREGTSVILAGSRVKIDMSDGSVWVNDSVRVYPQVTSRRFEIEVGTVEIGVAVNAGATVPNVVGFFREVYV